MQKRLKDNWLEEYKLVHRNPIYFLEMYWGKLYPDEKPELSDDEKQRIYDYYRQIPLIENMDQLREFEKFKEETRAKGIKDWEAFL